MAALVNENLPCFLLPLVSALRADLTGHSGQQLQPYARECRAQGKGIGSPNNTPNRVHRSCLPIIRPKHDS